MCPPLVNEVLRLPPELGPDPLGELVPVPVTAKDSTLLIFPAAAREGRPHLPLLMHAVNTMEQQVSTK